MDRCGGVYSYILCSYSPNWNLASLCFIVATVPYIGSVVVPQMMILMVQRQQHRRHHRCRRRRRRRRRRR
jgi:hypothetical protein